MFGSIVAKDYMSIKPVTFRADTHIFEAIQVLLQNKISGATVVNDANEAVGVISEMDCLQAIINVGYYEILLTAVAKYTTVASSGSVSSAPT